MLEHVPNPARMIQGLRRVLKTDGALIIIVPNERNWLICRLLGGDLLKAFHDWGHLHDFSRLDKIQTIFNGFRVVEVRETREKPLILLLGLYKGLSGVTKALRKIFGTSTTMQNERVKDKSSRSARSITKFLTIYKKYMPIPKLTLHTVIKLVKNGLITNNTTGFLEDIKPQQ